MVNDLDDDDKNVQDSVRILMAQRVKALLWIPSMKVQVGNPNWDLEKEGDQVALRLNWRHSGAMTMGVREKE